MAEIHLLTRCLDQEGAERLAATLELTVAASADVGPRWPQIRALGRSLQQLCRDLELEITRISATLDLTNPEVRAFRDELYRLAETFSQLGRAAEAYPS